PDWLGFSPWGQTLDRWRTESGIADLSVPRYFGLDPGFVVPKLEMGPLPHFEERVVSEDPEFITAIDYRGILRRDRRDGASMPEWIGHPVKGPEDWARYKAERLQGPGTRVPDLTAFRCAAERDGACVQLGEFPWGVFGTLRDIVGAEECLLAFYDYPEMVQDIIDTNVQLWLRVYEEAVGQIRVDHIHIWEDMSGRQGSLISMEMLERFMMPSYDRIVAFARSHGIPLVSVDTDGQVAELVPAMMRHGINVFMPFEVQAGNDVLRYRGLYPGLGIMGGLDKSALAKGKAEIHRELDRAEKMLARGGWVPGFDHLIPPDVPWASFEYAVKELRRLVFG
ncbi:MAG TPA: uroporphyrinogen decarboxylase family protein, partial [Spirochaetia bacterium]|nr:uroporphyrinogen decarboxylase family protein [Spirochaetia bacterium]